MNARFKDILESKRSPSDALHIVTLTQEVNFVKYIKVFYFLTRTLEGLDLICDRDLTIQARVNREDPQTGCC